MSERRGRRLAMGVATAFVVVGFVGLGRGANAQEPPAHPTPAEPPVTDAPGAESDGLLGVARSPEIEAIECMTCEGTGRAEIECFRCEGERRVRCGCNPEDPPSDAERALEVAPWRITVHFSLPEALRGAPAKHVQCISCMLGSGKTIRGDRCLQCGGKGHLPCARCKRRGQKPCSQCSGQGAYEGACLDCLGSGKHRRLVEENARLCPWCAGIGISECGGCEDGKQTYACVPCDATGKDVCKSCNARAIRVCARCGGRGKVRRVTMRGTTVRVSRCESCDGKRRVRCKQCTKGKVTCEICEGTGKRSSECACQPKGLQRCAGCRDLGYRSWEARGRQLLEEGRLELAGSYFDYAIDRATFHYRARRSTAEALELPLRLLDRERDDLLDDLRELRRKCETEDPEDG